MTVLTRIEEQGCGCGSADHPGDLISIDEAVAQILRNAGHVRESEEVALAGARGRTLAEPIAAIAAAPPFDNAAMDGFALNTACLVGPGPWRLPVVTRIPAGQRGSEPLPMGAAAQIFTGALMPDGADAVVMQENVRRTENTIIVSHEILAGAHVRRKGEDMAAGDMVVPAGRTLTGRDIAACAAAGRATVCVRRRLRVALVVTGDEVNSPGRTLSSGGIWDVNTPMLSALIPAPEIELVDVLGFRDNRAALRQQLSALADEVDLIVTTGGISVGEEDHVKPALSDLGLDMVFSGVAIKPGKPVSYGRLGQAHWLGLPGNPLSAFVTWQLFGTVLCQSLAGNSASSPDRRHAVLSQELRHSYGRCEVRLAEISGFDSTGREIVRFDKTTHSGRVARLPAADGVILIPSEVEVLPEGALVEFQPFRD